MTGMNEPEYIFRKLTSLEFEKGYQILCDVSNWLNRKGIHQWPKPLPKNIYQKWQERGENYGLFIDGKLAAVLSLIRGKKEQWRGHVTVDQALWLTSLATALEFKGKKLGRIATRKACEHLIERKVGEIYLNCVHGSGFLPSFYKELGFEQIARKSVDYPVGTFDMVLMRRRLS